MRIPEAGVHAGHAGGAERRRRSVALHSLALWESGGKTESDPRRSPERDVIVYPTSYVTLVSSRALALFRWPVDYFVLSDRLSFDIRLLGVGVKTSIS